jgi:hypothetical protein
MMLSERLIGQVISACYFPPPFLVVLQLSLHVMYVTILSRPPI